MTTTRCELFYGTGGHGGPYQDQAAAVAAAKRLLQGCKTERRIEVRAADFKTVLQVVTKGD